MKEPEKNDILIDQGGKKPRMHTVNEDIAKTLSGSSAKTVSDAINLAKEQERFEKSRTLSSGENKFWFALGVLFLLTSAGFFIWSIEQKQHDISIEPILLYQGIVTYDQVRIIGNFEPTSSLLFQKFKDIENEVKNTGLVRFKFSNIDPVSSSNLIEAFNWKPGNRFTTGLGNTFDFGVYKIKTITNEVETIKSHPFILFETNGTDQSFSGFSLWEDNILFDLNEMFEFNTQTTLDPIYQKKFENIVIESHDGRVLYDADENPLIIMIFIDSKHALITNSKEVVREFLKRLSLRK